MAKKRLFCLLLCVMLLLLAGCSTAENWQSMQSAADSLGEALEDPQLRQNATAMLDFIIADDKAQAYKMVAEVITEEDFQEPYDLMREYLLTVGSYKLQAASKNTKVQNGVTIVSVRYLMTAGEDRFVVEAARTDEITGLAGFYLTPYVEVQQTGTMATMEGANWLQWVLLVFGMLEMIFILVALVDCCGHKMEKKWLWILLILLGSLSVLLMSTDSGLQVNYNYGLIFSHTALIRYSTGGFMIRIYLPVGAIAYVALRKKLFQIYEDTHPSVTETQPQDETEA